MKYLLCLVLFFNLLFSYDSLILTQEEKDYIEKKKLIKVHNEQNWPPYNFNEDNKPKGFSIDYTNLIAKKLGLEVEYVSGYGWNEYLELLKKGEIDLINNISLNKEREEFIDFTKVFHIAANAIYVRSGSENIDSLEKLNGKTIIMPKGFFAQQFISKHYPKINQILVKDSLEALRQLSLGKADATIGKKNVLDYLISTKNISGVKVSNFVDDNRMVSLIRMGVPKGETILRDILEKAQNNVSDEELLNLKRKWFGVKINKLATNYLSDEEKDYLRAKETIKVCGNHDIRPFEFFEKNRKNRGMSIDILNLIKKDIGVQFLDVKTKSFQESLDYLKTNRCDILSTIDKTNIVLANSTLTHPVFNYQFAVITKKSLPIVSSLDEIVENPVSIKKGSLLIDELKIFYPNIKILETNSNYESLQLVSEGKAYYTLLPLPIASYYMTKFAMNNLYISRYTNLSYNIHFAVNNENPTLLSIMNKSIQNISEEQKRKVENTWVAVAVEERVDFRLIFQIVLIVVILVLILLYRQRVLNRHNNELKKANDEIKELSLNLEKRVKEEVEKNKEKTNQLIYQARLAQMGELVNMIAHQWRQPLTAISATSSNLILQNMVNGKIDKDSLHQELNLINEYSQHLSSTIDDFRNFYKKDKQKSYINFEEVLEKALAIISPSLEKHEIKVDLEVKDKTKFFSYPSEINQVILNILKNSEDILIEKKVSNPKINISVFREKEFLCLEIDDNGGGIDENIIDKIFDPYFSTKMEKDGTGIGLYMSKLIIEEHCSGSLNVRNTKYGVSFKISINSKA